MSGNQAYSHTGKFLVAESKTRTDYGRVGAGRRMTGLEWTSTVCLAEETGVPRAHQGNENNCLERFFGFIESKTRTYLLRVGTKRTAGWRGGVRQDWMPTEMFAQETSLPRTLQSIEDTSPRLPRSTNKRNPM